MLEMLKLKKNQWLQIWKDNPFFILTISAQTITGSALILFGTLTNLSSSNPPAIGCIIAGVMVFFWEIIYVLDRDDQIRVRKTADLGSS